MNQNKLTTVNREEQENEERAKKGERKKLKKES